MRTTRLIGGVFGLTRAQEAVWRAEQIDPGTARFTIGELVEIRGPVDRALLAEAIETATREAEVVLVRFVARDGRPVQELVPDLDVAPAVVDLGDEADPAAAARRMAEAAVAVPFDPTRAPLLAQTIITAGPDRTWWLFTGHHLVADGLTGSLVAVRAARIYTARERGEPVEPLPSGRLRQLVETDATYPRVGPRGRRPGLVARPARTPARAGAAGATRHHHRRPPRLTGHRHRARRELPVDLDAQLRVAGAATGRHASTFAVAAVAAYVHRLSGVRDLVLGLPVTGRAGALRAQVGMLANVLPLRLPVGPSVTVTELLAQAAGGVRSTLRRQRYRGEDLARELGAPDGLGALVGPVVNVMAFGGELRFGDTTATGRTLATGPVDDLAVILHDQPGATAVLEIEANAGRYGGDEVEAHLDQLVRVLDALTAPGAGGTPLARLDLLAPGERRLLLAAGTCDRPVRRVTIPAGFAAQVARTPDGEAVVDGDHVWTYAELAARADELAGMLAARGVRRGDHVALALGRSADAVAATLAVLRVGAAFVPLDLDGAPTDRLVTILDEARPALVITTAAQAAALPGDRPVLLLDGPPGTGGAGPPAPGGRAPVGAGPALADAAYVIFTSGSTGRPKGVVATHEGIASLVATAVERARLAPGSRVAQFASPSFDVAVFELVMALLTGGTLVVVPAELRTAGEPLLAHLRRHRVTHVALPPSLVAAFDDDADWPDDAVLLTGTEAVPAEVVARRAKDLTVVACYGLTEATVNSTLWSPGAEWCGGDGSWDGAVVPLGVPDPNTRAYVLDGALQPCPFDTVGELYIGGDGLARGYLGRPDLTAERFVADPHSPTGARMYRTGDLVRWRPDGLLEFHGRADDQIKVRGYRIEPAEVEAVLRAHPDVRDAAVVVREDRPGVKQLIGYVTPGGDTAPDPLDVRAAAAAVLVEHLVPAAVVVLDRLPVLPSGKLDRRGLPAPDLAVMSTGLAPRNGREAALAGIAAGVLGLPVIGVEDDLFVLGADSIMAIQLVSRARAEGLVLAARDVFTERTVARLALVAGDGDDVEDEDAGAAIGSVAATPVVAALAERGGGISALPPVAARRGARRPRRRRPRWADRPARRSPRHAAVPAAPRARRLVPGGTAGRIGRRRVADRAGRRRRSGRGRVRRGA